MTTDQQSTLAAVQSADISRDDWYCAIIDAIPNLYARGYLQCKIEEIGASLSSSSEDFREELAGVVEEYDIWEVVE